MICEKCKEQGLRSTIEAPAFGMRTAMYCAPWYDEKGVYHDHDRNTTTREFSCSNGHRWIEESQGSCPAGDWKGERTVRWIEP